MPNSITIRLAYAVRHIDDERTRSYHNHTQCSKGERSDSEDSVSLWCIYSWATERSLTVLSSVSSLFHKLDLYPVESIYPDSLCSDDWIQSIGRTWNKERIGAYNLFLIPSRSAILFNGRESHLPFRGIHESTSRCNSLRRSCKLHSRDSDLSFDKWWTEELYSHPSADLHSFQSISQQYLDSTHSITPTRYEEISIHTHEMTRLYRLDCQVTKQIHWIQRFWKHLFCLIPSNEITRILQSKRDVYTKGNRQTHIFRNRFYKRWILFQSDKHTNAHCSTPSLQEIW